MPSGGEKRKGKKNYKYSCNFNRDYHVIERGRLLMAEAKANSVPVVLAPQQS